MSLKLRSMSNPNKKAKVIAIQDPSGGFTAFRTDLTGLVVQGSSVPDAAQKLDNLLQKFIAKLEASREDAEIETISLV